MTADLVVYRSTHPDVLATWDELREHRREIGAKLHEFARAVDPERDRNIVGDGSGERVNGLAHDPDWPVPAGWRVVNRGLLHIVPRLSTKAGKAAAERLSRLQPQDPRHVLSVKHGIPSAFFGGSGDSMPGIRFYSPGVQQLGDALYVTWARQPEEPHDPAKWEPVKLSEYYAAIEAEAGGAKVGAAS